MAPDNDVGAVEDVGLVHNRLRIGRHYLLAWRSVDNDAARRMCQRETFGHSDSGRHANRPLGAVLVAVKRALGAAQRVVLDDHTKIRRTVVGLILRHQRRLQVRHTHRHAEAVLFERLRQQLHRSLLFEPDFRMPGDVIRERQKLGVHEFPGARRHLVAGRIGRG